jgi:hypothetical protein
MLLKIPPESIGCPGINLDVAGRRNPAFGGVLGDFRDFWTSVDVAGSHGSETAGHRIVGLSFCLQKYFIFQFTEMPPLLPLKYMAAATGRHWTSSMTLSSGVILACRSIEDHAGEGLLTSKNDDGS